MPGERIPDVEGCWIFPVQIFSLNSYLTNKDLYEGKVNAFLVSQSRN